MLEGLPDQHQIEDHLKLLKAFSSLNTQVQEDFSFKVLKSTKLDGAAKRILFVNMAVYRFEHWLGVVTSKKLEKIDLAHLPPLDVLMVWHAYSLNPRWYCEDSLRLHPLLQHLSFPLELAAANFVYGPTGEVITASAVTSQESIWSSKIPFDPRLNVSISRGRVVTCPHCCGDIDAEWTNEEKQGWVDEKCTLKCKECREWSGSRRDLGIARFLSDFSRAQQEPAAGAIVPHTIAGTLTTLHNIANTENAHVLILHLKKLCDACGSALDPSNPLLIESKPNWLKRTLSAYQSGTPFSIDLVGAVIRQSSFINKMVALGFTDIPDRLDGYTTSKRCLYRYEAFLKLMSDDSSVFFVPTLDIDLAWHTHQLIRGSQYCQDTIDLVGRLVDHNDDVEEGSLTDSFSQTARAWKAKFGVSYSGCDCLLKSDGVQEETGSNIITLLDTAPDLIKHTSAKSNFVENGDSVSQISFLIDNLKEVVGSACGGCGGCGSGSGCGGCGEGILNTSDQQEHAVFSCGGCGTGGCGSGKCGGGCGAGLLVSRNRCDGSVAACGGCGAGGCGEGGCGGGMV